jgi:signal transduction histidine kinase
MLEKQAKRSFTRDTSFINVLDSLAYGYFRISADSVFLYGKTALAYAKEAGYGKGESVSLRVMGNGYYLNGDYTNMLSCYQQALAIAEKINDPICIAKATINMAIMYYIEMDQLDEALPLLKRAGDIFERTKDSLNLTKVLTATGAIFVQRKQFEKALLYFKRTLDISTAMKNDYCVVTSKDNIGYVFFGKGLYKEALAYFLGTLDYFKHTDDKIRITKAATMVADTYFHLKDYSSALKYALQSLEAAAAIKGQPLIRDADKVLADIYDAKGDTRNALKYFKLFKDISDSVLNEAMVKKTAKLEARYEYTKKEILLKQEQEIKDALHRHTVRIKELQIFIAILLIVSLSVLAFVLFRSRAAKHKTNQILEANNQQIEHQALLLLKNNREKDKLFSIIAHDLKVPLYSLKNMLALLQRNSLSEAELEMIMEELSRDADFSAELVSNLLFWASSQMNGRVVSPVLLPLHQLVDDTLRVFVQQASGKKIRLKNELHHALSAWSDKTMIQIIFRNLVSNAIKFCSPGDTISIEGKTMNGAVEICVADTGIGIEKETLKRIAAKESLTTFGTDNEKGTGLGLLVCRDFVEANQGLFRVESEPGEGSRFYFTLPAVPS